MVRFCAIVVVLMHIGLGAGWGSADPSVPPDALRIGAFSQADPAGPLPADWQLLTFPGIETHTQYRLIRDQDALVVQAQSQAAAAGLIRYLKFDVQHHDWLSWRWKITHVLKKGDLHRKQGDDYPARIYVAFEFEPQRASWWQRMVHAAAGASAGRELPGTTLSYIWANRAARGTLADNPFTDQVKMIVLQSGNARANQWISEKRNIVQDYRQAFGHDPPPAMGIAIMTDTDNTGESATAYYGDITLSR